MQRAYLEVTFRHGKPLAAYYHLPREPRQRSARTQRVEPGMIVDYTDADQPVGIEITAPAQVTLDQFNALLQQIGQPPVTQADLAPLRAA